MARSKAQGRKKKQPKKGKEGDSQKQEIKGKQQKAEGGKGKGAKKNEKKQQPKKKNQQQAQKKKEQEVKKPLTAEELDRQMDEYMMKDPKTAEKKLEEDMDDYWAQKKSKETGDEGEQQAEA